MVRDRRVAARFNASLSRLKAWIIPVLVLDGLLEPDILLPGSSTLFGILAVDDELVRVPWIPLDGVVVEAVVEDPLTAKPGANGFTHPSIDSVAFGFATMVTLEVALLPVASVGPDVLRSSGVD